MISKRKRRYGRKWRSPFLQIITFTNCILWTLMIIQLGSVYGLYNGGFGYYQVEKNYGFDSEGYPNAPQTFPNMRFESRVINYSIESCDQNMTANILNAISIIEGNTTLTFVNSSWEDSQIKYTCFEKVRNNFQGEILGVAGPTAIKLKNNYIQILESEINLYKDEECPPRVTLHETLHAFGFDHSENPTNFMYGYLDCPYQYYSDYFWTELNKIYSET